MKIEEAHGSFCQYLILIRNQRDTTIKGHRYTLQVLRKFLQEPVSLDEVTELVVQRFFVWGRAERHWSAATYLTHHKRLQVFFRWAVETELVATNPLARIEKPKLERRLPKRLSLDDAQILLRAGSVAYAKDLFLRARNTAMIATFLYAGLRKSEVINLKVEDVDLSQGLISVRQGKGAKDRIVPVPEKLITILSEYRRVRTVAKTNYFFVSHRGDGLTIEGLKRIRSRLVAVTGKPFHFHMLRHTYATLMIEGGCDIYSLSKMMGHNDISTTTIYLSASVEHLRRESAKHPLNY